MLLAGAPSGRAAGAGAMGSVRAPALSGAVCRDTAAEWAGVPRDAGMEAPVLVLTSVIRKPVYE
ncbi:hypothetical protein GCM10027517_12590 [Phycicoccus ginsengisoli]